MERIKDSIRKVGTAHHGLLAVGLLVCVLAGCGGPANQYDAIVTGTVTVDGELAKSGTVTFHPVKNGVPAIGRINPDGSYSLRTGQGDLREADGGTVISGEYLVTVSVTGPAALKVTGPAGEGEVVVAEGGPPIPGPSLISQKYAQKETTDLRHTVKPGMQVIVLNLDPAEPTPPADETPATDEAAPSEETQPADEVVPTEEPAETAAETPAGVTETATPPSEPAAEAPPATEDKQEGAANETPPAEESTASPAEETPQ